MVALDLGGGYLWLIVNISWKVGLDRYLQEQNTNMLDSKKQKLWDGIKWDGTLRCELIMVNSYSLINAPDTAYEVGRTRSTICKKRKTSIGVYLCAGWYMVYVVYYDGIMWETPENLFWWQESVASEIWRKEVLNNSATCQSLWE